MTVEKPSEQEQQRLSAYEAALARLDQAYEQQLAQLKKQQQAQEDLWVLIDQFEELSIKAAQHMAVFQEAGMTLPEIAKVMCVPRSVARMFLQVAEESNR